MGVVSFASPRAGKKFGPPHNRERRREIVPLQKIEGRHEIAPLSLESGSMDLALRRGVVLLPSGSGIRSVGLSTSSIGEEA